MFKQYAKMVPALKIVHRCLDLHWMLCCSSPRMTDKAKELRSLSRVNRQGEGKSLWQMRGSAWVMDHRVQPMAAGSRLDASSTWGQDGFWLTSDTLVQLSHMEAATCFTGPCVFRLLNPSARVCAGPVARSAYHSRPFTRTSFRPSPLPPPPLLQTPGVAWWQHIL